jgi:hypothetical protein
VFIKLGATCARTALRSTSFTSSGLIVTAGRLTLADEVRSTGVTVSGLSGRLLRSSKWLSQPVSAVQYSP